MEKLSKSWDQIRNEVDWGKLKNYDKDEVKKAKEYIEKKVNSYYKEADDFYDKNKIYIDNPSLDESEKYHDKYLDLLDKADAKKDKLQSTNSLPKLYDYVPKSGRKKALKNVVLSGGAIAGANHIANNILRKKVPGGAILAKGNKLLGGIGIAKASWNAYKPLSDIKGEIVTDLANQDALENYHRDLAKKNRNKK